MAHSYAGRIGKTIEPVLRPLGFDWRIGVGIVSSFAAREVLVSSLAIIYGAGDVDVEDRRRPVAGAHAAPQNGKTVRRCLRRATCASLLVFFVLAMQCLPTQAVTRRETNSWKWAGFQFAYMTVLAYVSAAVVYQGLTALGVFIEKMRATMQDVIVHIVVHFCGGVSRVAICAAPVGRSVGNCSSCAHPAGRRPRIRMPSSGRL